MADSLAASDTGERLHPRPPRVCSGAFSPQPATLPELSAALQRMGASKASGNDGITISMIRMTFSVVGPHILHVVNSCITRCELPPAWRAATVVPLHKGGDVQDPSNYRPISILPVVSKLCERVVCSQLMNCLLSHNILCSEQYGFRPGLSTEAALLHTVTYVTDNIDKGRVTSLITADTSKAFDSVEHGRLLEKLGWYGIEQHWFRAWLGGRTQSVRGGSGSELAVTNGVVQGSILGPVLFLLFTNDMPQHVPYGKLVMYADDAQFLDSDIPDNLPDLKERIESNMRIALTWFTQNRLKVNPSKTEMIVIKSRRLNADPNFSVLFGNSEITPAQSVKVLGVTVDSALTWDRHISTIMRRCYCVLIGLSRIRRRMPRQTRQLLIEALVFPHLRYCISVWGGCTVTQQRRLQKCVNFGVRIVMGLGRRDRVTASLRQLGWLKVGELICERDLHTMFKLMNSIFAPELIRRHITRRADVSSRSTRASSNGQLQVPRVRTEFARRSFLNRAARAWNDLPVNVRCTGSFALFKKGLTECRRW